MSLLSLNNPPGWGACSALCILIVLLPEAKADDLTPTTTTAAQRNGGGSQCGGYTNQVLTELGLFEYRSLPEIRIFHCLGLYFKCE